MAVPDGWRRDARFLSQGEIDYVSPDGTSGLKISTEDFAGPNQLKAWKDLEPAVRQKSPGYHLLRMNETTVTISGRTEPAAIWEWAWQGSQREYHAIDLGFGKEGGIGFAIYLNAPDDQWAQRQPVFHTAVRTFVPTS